MDSKGDIHSLKMEPFGIFSCKYVKPRDITKTEFEEKYRTTEKQSIRIPLREDISNERVFKELSSRMPMSIIEQSTNEMKFSGETRSGQDVLLDVLIKEVQGMKTLVGTIASGNQNIIFGLLSEILETNKAFRIEVKETLGKITDAQQEIKEMLEESKHALIEEMHGLEYRLTGVLVNIDEILQHKLGKLTKESQSQYTELLRTFNTIFSEIHAQKIQTSEDITVSRKIMKHLDDVSQVTQKNNESIVGVAENMNVIINVILGQLVKAQVGFKPIRANEKDPNAFFVGSAYTMQITSKSAVPFTVRKIALNSKIESIDGALAGHRISYKRSENGFEFIPVEPFTINKYALYSDRLRSKHGVQSKPRKGGIKIHFAVEVKTHCVVAVTITDEQLGDSTEAIPFLSETQKKCVNLVRNAHISGYQFLLK